MKLGILGHITKNLRVGRDINLPKHAKIKMVPDETDTGDVPLVASILSLIHIYPCDTAEILGTKHVEAYLLRWCSVYFTAFQHDFSSLFVRKCTERRKS